MKKKKKRIVIALIIALIVVLFLWLGNNLLTVTYYTYRSGKVPAEFEGYRIVQISDLHNATFGKSNGTLLKKIQELDPDMVVVTGDVVDSNHTNLEVAVDFMNQLAEEYLTYYVTGNHEVWLEESEKQSLMDGLNQAGVICLNDASAEITGGEVGMTLVGLQDESLGSFVMKKVLREAEVEKLTILLAHEPQYFEEYSDYPVDLVFSGHAHGGQIRLPFAGGVIAPGQGLFPQYTEGIHERNGTTMVISRGLGNSVVPVRIFNPPEIVCVELSTGM